MEKCDKYNDEIFRIIICDEAGELKGEDRWEEEYYNNYLQSKQRARKFYNSPTKFKALKGGQIITISKSNKFYEED